MEFSTYDVDHDNWQNGNFAAKCGGGFWFFNYYTEQNINGRYSGDHYESYQKIWWYNHGNLKKTQLMIRPAFGN